MEFNIRKANIQDLLELKELEKSCFDETIRENFQFVLNSYKQKQNLHRTQHFHQI